MRWRTTRASWCRRAGRFPVVPLRPSVADELPDLGSVLGGVSHHPHNDPGVRLTTVAVCGGQRPRGLFIGHVRKLVCYLLAAVVDVSQDFGPRPRFGHAREIAPVRVSGEGGWRHPRTEFAVQ